MSLNLKIVQPSGVFFNGKIDLVTIRVAHGYIGLKENHQPFVSYIQVSRLVFFVNEVESAFAIGGGIVVCAGNSAFLVTESITSVNDINLQSEIARKEKIEKALKEKKSVSDFNRLQVELNDALNKIKVKSFNSSRTEDDKP